MFFAGFNHSVWSALWILGPIGLIAVGILLAYSLRKREYFFHFDPKNNVDKTLQGEFGPHCDRYQGLAKLTITLSVGAIAFLVNTWSGQKPPLTAFVENLDNVTPIVVGFFGAAIALCIAFMVLQTLWYEEYCHSPKHDTYRAWKYALCNVLGWTGLVAFILGFGWLATNLF